MKGQILLFNIFFMPFKSPVGFKSYRQFYFAILFYKTIKNKENVVSRFLFFHPAIYNNFHFEIR